MIGDKIAILDHFLSQSLWIFLPQFSEHRFRFNIVMWVPFRNNSSFFCIIQVTIFDLSLLIKDSNFYWLCQALYLESDYRLCLKNVSCLEKVIWKSDLKIRSRSVKKGSTIRSRSWSRKMVKSDRRSDQKVICRSRSWSVDQDRQYYESM